MDSSAARPLQAQMDAEDQMSDEEASRQIRLTTTRDRVMDHLFPPRKISNALRQDIIDCEETEADKATADRCRSVGQRVRTPTS